MSQATWIRVGFGVLALLVATLYAHAAHDLYLTMQEDIPALGSK